MDTTYTATLVVFQPSTFQHVHVPRTILNVSSKKNRSDPSMAVAVPIYDPPPTSSKGPGLLAKSSFLSPMSAA